MVKKSVRDIMVGSSEYPQIPIDYSLKQAIHVFKKSVIAGERCIKPIVALVFKGNKIAGTLRMRDIIRGLEPNFLKHAQKAQGFIGDRSELSIIWDSLFDEGSKRIAERPVTECIEPIKAILEPGDSIVKAAYTMINNDLIVVPVLENGEKLVGVVRMLEVFDELSSNVLEDFPDNIVDLKVQA